MEAKSLTELLGPAVVSIIANELLNIEIFLSIFFILVKFHGEFEWQEAKSEDEMYVSYITFVPNLKTNFLSQFKSQYNVH